MYTKRSFSVPGSAGSIDECHRVGHTEPDGHGKCYRCASRLAEPDEPPSDPIEPGRATMFEQAETMRSLKSFRDRDLPPYPDMDSGEIASPGAT